MRNICNIYVCDVKAFFFFKQKFPQEVKLCFKVEMNLKAILKLYRRNPWGVVSKLLDCDIVVNKLLSCYCIHFWSNRRGMNLLDSISENCILHKKFMLYETVLLHQIYFWKKNPHTQFVWLKFTKKWLFERKFLWLFLSITELIWHFYFHFGFRNHNKKDSNLFKA